MRHAWRHKRKNQLFCESLKYTIPGFVPRSFGCPAFLDCLLVIQQLFRQVRGPPVSSSEFSGCNPLSARWWDVLMLESVARLILSSIHNSKLVSFSCTSMNNCMVDAKTYSFILYHHYIRVYIILDNPFVRSDRFVVNFSCG